MNKARTLVDTSEKAPDAPAGPTQEEVLIEIRDLLRDRAAPLPAACYFLSASRAASTSIPSARPTAA